MKGFWVNLVRLAGVGILLLILFPLPIGPFIWGIAGFLALNAGIQAIKDAASGGVEPSPAAGAMRPSPAAKPVRVRPGAAARPFKFNIPETIPTDLKCPSCGASIGPTTRKCAYCGSILQPVIDLPEPVHLAGL